jgi:D-alanyl-D-alanine carboxypeptidase/D-alanyl-D-alanine-endopeptidase (penicillin-binding protein 4)
MGGVRGWVFLLLLILFANFSDAKTAIVEENELRVSASLRSETKRPKRLKAKPKKKVRRKPHVVKVVEPKKTVQEEVIDAFSDSITTDSLMALLICDTLTNDTLPWPESLKARLDTIIMKSQTVKTSQFALMVYDLTADSLLYAVNEKQTLRPASTMKLLTAITALDKLGGSYQFKTYLKRTGEVVDSTHTLKGNVYVVGGMDPRFNRDDLIAFVESLKKLGIDTIAGNLCADRSFKDKDLLGEGWCWDDDNPVLSPLVYSRKDQMMERFVSELAEQGITLKGEIVDEVAPFAASEICSRAHSIDQILSRMMKESDNLYAESMYYHLAAAQSKPARAAGAKHLEQLLMRRMGLDPSNYRLADGSGLSLYNYVTAELEVSFLRYAYENSTIYNQLIPSLPLAAYDGTLAKRLNGTKAAGSVRAKTGTLTCVSSLAGYAKASNGHVLAFCIINQGVLRGKNAKAFQDRVCVAMCK